MTNPRLTLAVLLLCCSAYLPIPVAAQASPQFRPALLGTHKRSLINLVNAESLMKRGQTDAIVMFSVGVNQLGFGYNMQVFRGTPKSDILKQELLNQLERAQFMPAVVNGLPRAAYMDGTVVFAIVNGKPHVRIFLNQDESELNKRTDYISPQLVFLPGNLKYKGIRYPPAAPGVAGTAAITLDIDAAGKVSSSKVSYEHPPNLGFGVTAAGPLRDANFIPAFRNGKPVACRYTMAIIFNGPGPDAKTG